MLKSIATVLVFATLGNLWAEPGFLLDGQPVREIVVPENPSKDELYASGELAKYIEKMTGAKLEQKKGTAGAGRGPAIFIGEAALKEKGFSEEEMTELGAGGYRIRSKGGNIYIAGGKYGGTVYGMYAFLEKSGARFYAADHEVIPQDMRIDVPSLDIKKKPFFEWRLLNTYLPGGDSRRYQGHPWHWKEGDEKYRIYVGWDHTSPYLVPFIKYAGEHPEYFAKFTDGKSAAVIFKDRPHNKIHICMSNKDVRKIALERLMEWIEKQKDREFFAVTQSDGYGWCMCEECKKLDTVPGEVKTDRLLDFVNELAREVKKKYPDKIILTAAYCKDTAPVARRLKPESNVRIVLAAYTPEVQDQGHWFDHPKNIKFLKWYEDWIKYAPGQVYMYEYPHAGFSMLQFPHEQHYNRIRRYAKDGVKGFYFCGRTAFMRALFDYVSSRLAWDPGLDSHKLTEEFIGSYYGPAAPKIMEIYDCLSMIAAKDDRLQGTVVDMKKFVTSEEIEKIISLFEDAENLAKDSPECLRRVRDDESFALYTDILKHNPAKGTAKDVSVFKKRLGKLLQILSSPATKNSLGGRLREKPEYLVEFLLETALIQSKPLKFDENPTVKQLMSNPDSVKIDNVGGIRALQVLPDGSGYRMPLELFEGGTGIVSYGYECPRRKAMGIRAKLTGDFVLRCDFELKKIPAKPLLTIEGQDDDKYGTTQIRISLNGEEIFKGRNQFVEKGWSTCSFEIPDGILKEGKNELVIENMEEGDDPFSQWVMICDVKLTGEFGSALKAKPLLLSHFDAGFDADHAGVPKAQTDGEISINPNGKWGGALDCGYSRDLPGTLYYLTTGNLNPSSGTMDFWVKLRWKPGEDDKYRTFMHLSSPLKDSGYLLFKYDKDKNIKLLPRGSNGGNIGASIAGWAPDTWHHVAFTWDAATEKIQLFTDGVLAAEKKLPVCVEMPRKILVACQDPRPRKTNALGGLIDELRICDYPVWNGRKVGEKVFDPPSGPYEIK